MRSLYHPSHGLQKLFIAHQQKLFQCASQDSLRQAEGCSGRKALGKRPAKETDALLFAGLRYPWPVVAKNAAAVIVALKRTDLVPRLVDFLDEPDPRAPFVTTSGGKESKAVRELVRIDHSRNCLLCHAPGNTPDVKGSADVVLAPMPLPAQGYYQQSQPRSPDIFVKRIRAPETTTARLGCA